MVNAYIRILFAFLIASTLLFSTYGSNPSRASDITLIIDTYIDTNDPAYQVCSDAPDDCSLRGAISISNVDITNHYILQMPGGEYYLSIPGASEDDNVSGDLDIKGKIIITGMEFGVNLLGNRIDRVLHVHPDADVIIESLYISGGKGPDGASGINAGPGGGVYNQGRLTIRNSVLRDNHAGNGESAPNGDIVGGEGGSGGGIQNEGYLSIENSIVSDNTAGVGGAGYACPCSWYGCDFCDQCSKGGNGGKGGGINNAGILNINNSWLENNFAGPAGPPGSCVVWDRVYLHGEPGIGGGIANQRIFTIVNSTLERNRGELEGGGLSNRGFAYLFYVTISNNNASNGGGLSNRSHLEIENSQVINNTAGVGGGIYNIGELRMLFGSLNSSNAFLGGGLYNDGEAILAGNSIQNNWTQDGPDGADETGCPKVPCPPTDGGSPHGGGIYNAGKLQLNQGTVSGNATGDGGKGGNAEFGGGYPGGNGGSGGFGGGIYNQGSVSLNFTSVVSNTTGDGGIGGASPSGNGLDGVGGFGGGIYNSGVMTVTLGQVTGNQTGAGAGGAGYGGGIANLGKLTYSSGSIANNQTSPAGDGGGVYASGPMTITASTIVNNIAGGRGGGIYAGGESLYGANDIVARNVAGPDYAGSGVYIQNTDARLLHTSLAQNTGGDGSGITLIEASLQMTNTILVSHTIGISVALSSNATVESTLWGDGIWANEIDWTGSGSIITGTHNYWFEPGFIDPFYFDYHISPASAALDRGAHAEIETDIDNQPRPNPATGIADLGADEYWDFIPISQVDISGPMTGTALTTISFTATIMPEAATPNILFYWMPPPDSGQWTNMANYLWTRPGMKIIEVTAINAGSRLTETFTISLERGFPRLFLPIVIH